MEKKRILIVDDEENFAYIMKMNLENAGEYEVWVETNSSKAVSSAGAMRPDLILLDVIMPRKDGFQVLEELKKDKRTMSIPVIMLTALEDKSAKIRASERFSEDYLVKPVATDALREKIENVLKRRPS